MKEIIQAGLESKNNLIRRATLVATFPAIAIYCIASDGVEHAVDWAKDVAKEVPSLAGDVKALWNAPA